MTNSHALVDTQCLPFSFTVVMMKLTVLWYMFARILYLKDKSSNILEWFFIKFDARMSIENCILKFGGTILKKEFQVYSEYGFNCRDFQKHWLFG